MKPVIIDTSIWIEWFRGRLEAARVRSRDRILYMSAVVAMELLSRVKDRRADRLVNHLVETFSRTRRLLLPLKEDYNLAGSVLAELNWPASKKSNDALIATSARSFGAEVWTRDARDFSSLASVLRLSIVSDFD